MYQWKFLEVDKFQRCVSRVIISRNNGASRVSLLWIFGLMQNRDERGSIMMTQSCVFSSVKPWVSKPSTKRLT